MTEQAKAARRAYKREWQRQNRDKLKAYQDRYWERKAAEAEAEQQERDEAAKGDANA